MTTSSFKRIETLERYFKELDLKNLTSTVLEDRRRIDALEKEMLKLRREIGEMNTARAKAAQSEPLAAVMANVELFQAFIAKADVLRTVIAHTELFEFIMTKAEAIRGVTVKNTSLRGQPMEEGGDTSKLLETVDRLEAAHKSLFESVDRIHGETIDEIGTIKGELEEVKMKVDLLAQSGLRTQETAKFKIQEPKPYRGNRDANEVDNFLFDLEHYFAATRVSLDSERLGVVPMYLEGDAKLWWRHKAGLCTVNTWYDFKKNLKVQFSPENVAFTARCKLNKLQHTGSIQEYIQAFQAITLDLPQMHEEERFFNFMNGLKPWVRDELTRREVKDHFAAIATAESIESLYNFSENTFKRKFPSNSSETRPNKLGRPLIGEGEQNNFNSGAEKHAWNVGNSEQRPFDGNNAERKNSQTTVPGSDVQSTKILEPWNVGNSEQRPFDGNNAERKNSQITVPGSNVQSTKMLRPWNVGNSEQRPFDGNNAERKNSQTTVPGSNVQSTKMLRPWNVGSSVQRPFDGNNAERKNSQTVPGSNVQPTKTLGPWNVVYSDQRPFNAEMKNSQTTVPGSNVQPTKTLGPWNVGNSEQKPLDGNNAERKNSQTTVPGSNVQPTNTLGPWNVGNSEQKPFDGNDAERKNSQSTVPGSNVQPIKTFGPKC